MSDRPVIVHALPPNRIKRKSKVPAQPAEIRPARIVFARKSKRVGPFLKRKPAND